MKKQKGRSRREKENLITMEQTITPEMVAEFYHCPEMPEMNLRLEASLDVWETLHDCLYDDPHCLGELILNYFVIPVYEDQFFAYHHAPPRGLHAKGTGDPMDGTEAELMHEARLYVAAALALTEYWLDIPTDRWPDDFKNLVASLPVREKTDKRTVPGRFSANKIVWAMWKQEFEKRMQKFGLAGPKDLKNFREQYIRRNKWVEDAKRDLQQLFYRVTIEDLMNLLLP